MALKVILNEFFYVSFCLIAKVIFMKLGQKKRSCTTILPDDVTLEILLRLDPKSLMRFKCVCKSWKSIINHSCFINMHLKHQVPYTVFVNHRCPREIFSFGRSRNFDKISNIIRIPVANVKSIEGSDRGILCLTGDNNAIYLWNPAINQVKKIPSPPFSNSDEGFRLGFGYNPMTNDFTVVGVGGPTVRAISSTPFSVVDYLFTSNNEVAIYSLRRNSWKRSQMPHIFNSSDVITMSDQIWLSPVVSGCIHWMLYYGRHDWSQSQHGIVSFDMNTEEFKLFDIPEQVEKCWIENIGKSSESLALFTFVAFTPSNFPIVGIWVMKEYGISTSWIKQQAIEFPGSSIIKCPFTQYLHFGDRGFASDSLLLSSANGLYIWHIHPENEDERIKCFCPTMNWLSCFPDYVESIFQIN
ncbi:F-box domain containing protein [Trema orientale]|uniref:F-box domain containing protein n=1 Tax=Trema orientale TaxID=63057 RepID=A0A2P5C4Q6_TREOI|nr:F-box domain containing protein [Trema orientale]